MTVNVQTPQSGNAKIDQAISVAVRDDALRAVNETEWSAPQEKDRKSIEAEYITFLAKWDAPDRVKKLALELFQKSALQHFKNGRI